MSTNSILSKIRQEIERRVNILTNVYAEQVERKDEEMMNYYHGKVIALEELRPFLDTLSEEPDKSLEEAAEKGANEYYVDNGCSPFPNTEKASYISGFIAGAEWKKNALLEWARERYKSTISNVGCYTGHSVWAEVIEKLESL